MSKIAQAFQHANGKAFIPFITCGDPSLEVTKKIVQEMVEAGADLIELGIPFSDPTAEGPVIQAANLRALSGGVTTDDIFQMVRELRETVTIPMVFMTYANVVFSYGGDTPAAMPGRGVSGASVGSGSSAAGAGVPGAEAGSVRPGERFIRTCQEIGIDGLILPDVPFEEKAEFEDLCNAHDVDLISMIAPTSHNRIAMIAKEAKGFLYIVSSLGVTGTRSEISTDLASMVKVIRENTATPCAIGFGISTPEQAAKMSQVSDGAIVGSAIVKLIGQYGEQAPQHVGAYVHAMASAVHEG